MSEQDTCPHCGAPMKTVTAHTKSGPYVAFHGQGGPDCEYAAGLLFKARAFESNSMAMTKRAERAEAERDELRRAIDRHKYEREQYGGWQRAWDVVLISKREALEAEE